MKIEIRCYFNFVIKLLHLFTLLLEKDLQIRLYYI